MDMLEKNGNALVSVFAVHPWSWHSRLNRLLNKYMYSTGDSIRTKSLSGFTKYLHAIYTRVSGYVINERCHQAQLFPLSSL